MLLDRRKALKLVATLPIVAGASSALGLEREANGYYLTGTGVRVFHSTFASADLYIVSHYMMELPERHSKQMVIDLDVGKVFSARVLRDLDVADIRDGFREAFVRNGYADQVKINLFLSAFTHQVKKGTLVRITYDPTSKLTVLTVQNDKTVTVPGIDFMRATWAMWFGSTDQPELGDKLISRLP